MLSPKISKDWDVDISTIKDAKLNYEKAKSEMRNLVILFAAEHLLMCIPIWILSYNIYYRNIYLDEFFPQLDEEIWSTKLSYILSIAGPVIFLLIPFVQYHLFILYNKYGHPWRKLLEENLRMPEWLADDPVEIQAFQDDVEESADSFDQGNS